MLLGSLPLVRDISVSLVSSLPAVVSDTNRVTLRNLKCSSTLSVARQGRETYLKIQRSERKLAQQKTAFSWRGDRPENEDKCSISKLISPASVYSRTEWVILETHLDARDEGGK